jgi:CRISPR-associated protein Cmr4
MASRERSTDGKRGGAPVMSAEAVLAGLLDGAEGKPGLSGSLLQVGGDATTGRGQLLVTAV